MVRLLGDNKPAGACLHCSHSFHEGPCLVSTVSPIQAHPTIHCECNGHGSPLDMILPCPACGTLHVDAPEPDICVCGHTLKQHDQFEDVIDCCLVGVERGANATDICPCGKFEIAWTNPPHKSHLCHTCGIIWRPADIPTNGVAEIKTRGEKDTWPEVRS